MDNNFIQYIYEKYKIKSKEDLHKKLVELSSIYEINQKFMQAKNMDEIADLLLLVPMGRLLVAKSLILIRTEDGIYMYQKGKWNLSDNFYSLILDCNISKPMFAHELSEHISPVLQLLLQENKVEIILPIYHHSTLIGYVLFGEKINALPYTNEDVQMLQTIFNLNVPFLLNAYMINVLKNKNLALDNHVQILRTILETSHSLDSLFNAEEVQKVFLLTLLGRLTVTQYLWIQCEVKPENCKISAQKGISFSRDSLQKVLHYFQHNKGFVNPEVINEEKAKILGLETGYLLVPYIKENELRAFLILGPKLTRHHWQEIEIEFISILFAQVQHILENLDLLQQKIEKEIIERELEVAKSIQSLLLPKKIPHVEKLDIAFFNQSARQVGGDYCDIIQVGNTIYFVIADVSGKSIPAALLMSNVQSALKILIDFRLDLTDIIYKLNNQLCENTSTERFVTLFIGKLDLQSYKFEYVDAGHNPPIYFDPYSQQFTSLQKGGVLLGMLPNMSFEKGTIYLKENSILFMYTDGVTETLNHEEKEWGEEKLIQFIKSNHTLSSHEFKQKLLLELKHYSKSEIARDDDITFIVLKRN